MIKILFRVAVVAAIVLLLPLLAMLFSDEVVWDLTDFAVAGVLLGGTGLTYELAVRKAGNNAFRVAVGVTLTAALLIIWLNLAVGIIGTEGNPANLMYIGVLAVGIIGAIIARLQPYGMSRALFATAFAQAMIVVITLIAGLGYAAGGQSKIVILNGFFIALWVGSALLFRKAAREKTTA